MKFNLLALLICFLPSFLWSQNESTVTVSVVNGEQVRCITENKVDVQLTPNPNRTLKLMKLFWDENSPAIEIKPGESFQRSHTYPINLPEDFCEYDCPISNGICRRVTVVAEYTSGTPENNSMLLTFKMIPEPSFLALVACINNDITVENRTCPSNDEDMVYQWEYSGNVITGEKDPTFQFNQAGNNSIKLSATNVCGTKTTTRTIRVIEPAIPELKADSNVNSENQDSFFVCASGKTTIRLVGSESEDASRYNWTATSGVTFIGNTNRDTARIEVTDPGEYLVELEVDNVCNVPNKKQIFIKVFRNENLTLQPTPDTCLSLLYTPNPLIEGAKYEINGKTYLNNEFPVPLSTSPNPYIVKATLVNPCNNLEKTDTFYVSSAQSPQIIGPGVDTSICQTARPITLESNIMGGRWMIGNKDLGGIFNPSDYPIGDVMLEYEVGSGNCLAKTTRKITIIPGTPLMLPQDTQLCQKDDPLALVAFPAGGVWAGSSVSSDNFDPSIGSGEYTLTYQYERSTDGCISEASINVKVFEVPQINIPDSIAVCNTDKPLDINQLTQPNLNPMGGNLDWSGSGISGNFFQTQDAGGEGLITLTSEYYFLKGCSAIDSTVISIGPVPETQVGPDTSLCTNQGQYILEGTPAGGEWIGNNGAVVSSPLNLLTTPLGKTSYWYITAKGTSCENRDSFTLDLIDSKGLNAGDDLFVCENLTQIDLPNVNGSWSGPELSGARTINLQNLSIGTFTYTLLDNSLPKACNTDDIELTIHPLPQANFELPSLECTSSEFQIQNNSVGAEKFEWNFGDGRLNMENNPRLSFPISGNYRIKLEAIKVSPLNGQNICQTSLEKEIKIIDPPQKIDFSPSVNRVCSPLTTDFINKSIGENLKFSWDFGNGQTGNVDQPLSITYTAIGSDTIYKVILTADNGCGTIQDEMEVEVLAAPVARFASEFRDNYCSGEPIPFGHRSFGTELKWDFGNGNIYLGENPLPQKFFTTIDKSDTVIIFLEAKNQCGIDSALQPLIIVPTDARAAITLPKSKYCVGDTVILESLSRPVDGRSIWQLPDGAQFEGLKLSIPLLDTGSQVVKLKSLSCGEDSAQVSFQVFPLPNLSIDAPSVSCPGEKILIKSMTDGLLGPIFFNDSLLGITNFLELMVPQSSQGVIKTTSQNQAGCISSVEKLIQIVPGPMGNILIPDTICSKELFNLQSSSANNITCSWQLDGGVSIAGCQVSVSLDNHGLLDGNLIIQNDVGCRDSMFFNLFVREKPVADFDISVVEDCFPGTVILTNQSWGENGIEWLLPDGSLKNANSFLYEIGQSGKFNIGLRATRDQICFDEVYRPVEIYPLPDIKLNFQEGCTVESGFSLEVESLPNAVIELHGLVNGQGSFFDKLLKGEYWINAESREGCIKDTLIQIPEVREFKASIEGADSIEIIMGQNLNLIATVNETNVKSLWLPSLNSGLNEEVRPLRSGYIIFEAVNSRGCILRDSVFIRVEIDRETGIFIPQAFTPNNDGVNDIFMVRSSNPGLEKIADFKIFGPAGDLVFQMKDGIPNSEISGWNGELAQSGVYVYLAELEFIDGIKTIKKGDVTLIR